VNLDPSVAPAAAESAPSFAAAAAAVNWTTVVPIRVRSTALPLLPPAYGDRRVRFVGQGPERLI
jgi:hypothetical protein